MNLSQWFNWKMHYFLLIGQMDLLACSHQVMAQDLNFSVLHPAMHEISVSSTQMSRIPQRIHTYQLLASFLSPLLIDKISGICFQLNFRKTRKCHLSVWGRRGHMLINILYHIVPSPTQIRASDHRSCYCSSGLSLHHFTKEKQTCEVNNVNISEFEINEFLKFCWEHKWIQNLNVSIIEHPRYSITTCVLWILGWH